MFLLGSIEFLNMLRLTEVNVLKLKKVLHVSILVLLLVLLFSIRTTFNFGNSEDSYSVSQDQTLYFRTEEIDFGDHGMAFLMNTTSVNGGLMETNHTRFVSLPLAENFTFSNLTVTVYHTLIPPGSYQLWIEAGWLDIQNQSHMSHFYYENLEVGTQVTSRSFAVNCCGIRVFEGQRLWLELQTSSSNITFFWGDPTHDSRVSYNGTASYIPEFPSFLVLPVLIVFSLIAVALKKRKF